MPKIKALNLSDYIYIYSNSVIYKCFINNRLIFQFFLTFKCQASKNLSQRQKSLLNKDITVTSISLTLSYKESSSCVLCKCICRCCSFCGS